mgnify:CR=1 FL=1
MMEFLADSADVQAIGKVMETIPLDGITTNPSILAKSPDDLAETMKQLKDLTARGLMLHVQVTAPDCAGMLDQAKKLAGYFGKSLYVKIPVTGEGVRAMRLCKSAGLRVTATAVFSPMQAVVAAKAGADYIAPYVNRIDNITADGVHAVAVMADLLKKQGYPARILAASFKNVQQMLGVAACGCDSLTASPELLEKLIFHPYTDLSCLDFGADWKKRFGSRQITDFIP